MKQETLDPIPSGRQPYSPPSVEFFALSKGLSVLEVVSLEGEILDFEDGEDF